ncbi:MAG: Holliday junction resolvase RuvX [Bdellovibrionota bacterium]
MGIAISDPLGLTAQPQPFVQSGPTLWTNLLQLIDQHHIGKIVVGIPLNMNGTHSSMTDQVNRFA